MVHIAWMGMAGLALVLFALAPAGAQTGTASPAPAAVTEANAEASGPVPVAEPDGYRMENYRAPTPATLKGAQVLDTAAAERLWRDKSAVFLDVLPRDVKPANLAPGTVWRDKPRDDIPGSIWLPNTGYGGLSADMDDYFRHHLDALVAARPGAPLVFYCLTDCWMSWNAARRAVAYGYRNIAWYPAGSDGWAKAGLPLERTVPAE